MSLRPNITVRTKFFPTDEIIGKINWSMTLSVNFVDSFVFYILHLSDNKIVKNIDILFQLSIFYT